MEKVSLTELFPILCDPMECSPASLPHPWYFPDKNTGVGCHFLLQESNLGLSHCEQTLYHLRHQGSPMVWKRRYNLKNLVRATFVVSPTNFIFFYLVFA